MADNETPPIVAPNPATDQAWSALRQIAIAAGGWAIGRGYLEADTAAAIGTVLLLATPVIYGQWQTRHRAKQLGAIRDDPRVPSSVVK